MSVVNHTRVVRVPVAGYVYSTKRSNVPRVTPDDLLDFDANFTRIEVDSWLLKNGTTHMISNTFENVGGLTVQDVINFIHTECTDDTKAKDFGFTVYLVYVNQPL